MSPPVIKVSVLTTPPSLKLKLLPKPVVQVKMLSRFPSAVEVLSPITLDRTGGNYLFGLDVNALAESLGSGTFQPLDSDLTAIAALTTTAYGRSLLTLANATAFAAEVDSFFLTPAEGNAAYQPLDSDLTAIAALTTTSYGRAFLALADAAAARTAIGAVIGTNVQAYDADLDALSALSGTNTIYYRSAANTWSAVTIGTNLAFAGGTLSASGASLANPTGSVGLTAVNGVATTAMRSDAAPPIDVGIAPTWTGAHIFNTASGDSLTVNPPAFSTNKGLKITQTSPNAGSVTGPLSYNLIDITHQLGVTGSEQQASGLRLNMNLGGSSLAGHPVIGGYFNVQKTIANVGGAADKIGVVGSVYLDQSDSGGGYYGENPVCTIANGGTAGRAVGSESGTDIRTGGAAAYRYGYMSANYGVNQGSTLDAAYVAGNIGTSGGAFKIWHALTNSLGQAPIATTGSLFKSDTAFTVAHVFDMANATVTGNIMNFPNATISGDGDVTVASTLNASHASNSVSVNLTSGSVGFQLYSSNAGGGVGIGTTTAHDVVIQRNSVLCGRFSSSDFSVSLGVKSSAATAGIGYTTGAGGTVTQATSKSTGVTLNKASGAITMNNAALAAGTIVSFVLTNSAIAATDVLVLNHISGGTPGSYALNARASSGAATIDVRNETAGSLSEAIVIQFALIKGVNS